jgi:hypothetical protein
VSRPRISEVRPPRGHRRHPVTGEDHTLLVDREVAPLPAEQQPGKETRTRDQRSGQPEEADTDPSLDQNHS